ncbi:MAG: hypothetical protein HY762_00720 [Planctomycetes bacterium]|nr:hypothetical protein [Planctomycetota bacterium]
MYIIGIDEAGYGPKLGPLIMTAVVFESGVDNFNDLWASLPCRLVVCDSKKAYQPARGIGTLERTVLAFTRLLARRSHPERGEGGGGLNCFDKYADSIRCSVKADESEITFLAGLLAEELSRYSIRFLEAKVRVVDALEFNNGIRRHGNKSDLLFEITTGLLKDIFNEYGSGVFYIGKQGGRTYYYEPLRYSFPDTAVSRIKETHSLSRYRLISGISSSSDISFLKDAEDRHFTVALASMFCKYTRELEMLLLNGFFRAHLPSLKPTAGYPLDAKRFIREVTPLTAKLGLPISDFVRVR